MQSVQTTNFMKPTITITNSKLYPTPSPSPTESPTASCPASPPPNKVWQPTLPPTSEVDSTALDLVHDYNESLANATQKAKKRKFSKPVKTSTASFLSNDANLGIVQLDVYNLYLLDPKSLVFKKKQKKSVCLINTDSIDESITVTERRPIAVPCSVNFDMSLYRNTDGAPCVLWKKGSSLTIPLSSAGYDELTEEEIRTCSTLRILPDQYLHIKQTILSAAESRGPFKKRDAKSWFRIDVNKTAVLFDWFRAIGWIPSDEEWERRARENGLV